MLPNFKQKNQPKGQTMMEMIIALGIVTLITTSVLALAVATIKTSSFSKQKFQAINLAQEGLEIVRNIRDTNWLQKELWNTDLEVGTYNSISYLDGKGWKLKTEESPPLIDNVFKREITIEEVPSQDQEIKITVKVSWQEHGRSHAIELYENLTNWRSE